MEVGAGQGDHRRDVVGGAAGEPWLAAAAGVQQMDEIRPNTGEGDTQPLRIFRRDLQQVDVMTESRQPLPVSVRGNLVAGSQGEGG
jgi:hypothetical protein